ncbi:MAG TPA: ATP phosphoribosyltransferase regulatory subunit [Thermoanaerobaculia bacterium]|nr:ATP phosphoribosyltransferase regulatory subunit [Thermoanaerobaculia bacterium]
MRVSSALPRGVSALLFEAARERRALESRLAGRLEEAGYSEVVLPILDFADPYEELLPPASRRELYRFVDREGELLLLRSDFTPLLARLLAPRLPSLALPLRLFYRGDVVRCRENRAGGLEESFQLGAELVGESTDGEGEILRLFLALLAASGAHRLQVIVGFAGALDALLLERAGAEAAEVAAAVARRERGPARRAGRAVLEVIEEGRPADPGALGPAAASLIALEGLVTGLAAEVPEIEVKIDLAEFACLEARDYYDGVVFRAFAAGRAQPVGGGGRYDTLFRRLGASLPAVGFTLGLDGLGGGDR